MKKNLTATLALLLSLTVFCGALTLSQAQLGMQTPPKPVKAKAGFTKYAAHPGGKIKLTIPIAIDEGWHVFGKKPDIGGIKPLNVTISAPKEIKVSVVEYDKPEKIFLDAIKKDAYVYHKKALAASTLTVSPKAKLKRYFLRSENYLSGMFQTALFIAADHYAENPP